MAQFINDSGQIVASTTADPSYPGRGNAYLLTPVTPLAILGPAKLPVGTVGSAYAATKLAATGGTGKFTWSATGLPAGLSLASDTGTISGTPTTTTGSPFTVQVTVTDGSSAAASRSYTVTINTMAACDVGKIGTVNVPDVKISINEALGLAGTAHDLNHDGVVNVSDVQIVVNAALGLGCGAT